MILTFTQGRFEALIKSGAKMQTIREDKSNRWHEGMTIHFWSGNPRNVSKNPFCFGTAICNKIHNVDIDFRNNNITRRVSGEVGIICFTDTLDKFAIKDGFQSYKEMKRWFNCDTFTGKIIYWTDFKAKQ